MFHVFLIILLFLEFCHSSNHPILIAKPYPFNRSESSRIECFSNDQGIILSLTIIAPMLDINFSHSSLQYSENNITKNGSITLIIPAPFNYSQLDSKIECRSKYHHGEQKIDQLNVLSVVEIPQKELLSINTYVKQMVIINCLTYGTNVFVHWNFSKDISTTKLGPLPIGIHIHHKFTINDTLIIDHVSYSDHCGYYRCYATNRLLGKIYEDNSIIYLNVKKNTIWIPIIIACVIIGICILIIIFCSKYCQRKRKKSLEEKEISQQCEQIVPKEEESIEIVSSYDKQKSSERIIENIEESRIQQKNISHSENSNKSFLLKNSPQFILSHPFLDPNVQPISSIKQHTPRRN